MILDALRRLLPQRRGTREDTPSQPVGVLSSSEAPTSSRPPADSEQSLPESIRERVESVTIFGETEREQFTPGVIALDERAIAGPAIVETERGPVLVLRQEAP